MKRLITVKKLSDVKPKQPKCYLKDFVPIPQAGVAMISSRGGYGKTFLSIRMALEFVKENNNSKVCLWLSEDPEGIVKVRSEAILKDFMANYPELEQNIDIVNKQPVQLAYKERGIFKPSPKWAQLIDDLMEYDLIVFDPLLSFYGGDENDNSQARIFMQPFMDFAQKAQKSIIILHHNTKPSQDNASKTRGAGAFTDACRIVYTLDYPDNKDNLTLRKVTLKKDNWGIKHFFGNTQEINVLPAETRFNEYKEPEIDKVQISYSKHITEGYKTKWIDMDKIQDLVKSDFYYSATGFENGYRNRENAKQGQNLIILDFDEGLELEKAKEVFSFYDCVIATTKSHQKEKNGKVCDRFRVVLKLDEIIELNPEQYSKLMTEINKTFGADEACKDVSRAWTPCKNAQVFRYYGKPFSWRTFLHQANMKELKKTYQDDSNNKIEKAISTLFDNEFIEGNRNNTAVRALKWLQDEGYSGNDIKNLLDNEIEKRGGLGDGEKEKKQLYNNHLRSV